MDEWLAAIASVDAEAETVRVVEPDELDDEIDDEILWEDE